MYVSTFNLFYWFEQSEDLHHKFSSLTTMWVGYRGHARIKMMIMLERNVVAGGHEFQIMVMVEEPCTIMQALGTYKICSLKRKRTNKNTDLHLRSCQWLPLKACGSYANHMLMLKQLIGSNPMWRIYEHV